MKTLAELLEYESTGNKPALSYSDLLKMREEGNKEFIAKLAQEKGKSALESLIGRSGILPLYRKCTVNNYNAETPEQKRVKQFAYYYLVDFNKNNGKSFIFSGGPGTGKNHLASAICNKLMLDGKKCAVITISSLMIQMRKCYSKAPKFTEDQFIDNLVNLDLLILDEVGLQRGTDNEKLILNQVIDQRVSNFKPVGMLTNFNSNKLEEILGVRIMDRMKMNGGEWLPFDWFSYRK